MAPEYNPYRKTKPKQFDEAPIYEANFGKDFFGNLKAWIAFNVFLRNVDNKIRINREDRIVIASGVRANNLGLEYLYERLGIEDTTHKIDILSKLYRKITGEEFHYSKPISTEGKLTMLESMCKPFLGRGEFREFTPEE